MSIDFLQSANHSTRSHVNNPKNDESNLKTELLDGNCRKEGGNQLTLPSSILIYFTRFFFHSYQEAKIT